VDVNFKVVSKDEARRWVFGWASVAKTTDGKTVIDKHGDAILIEDLEVAAAEFVKFWRRGGEMHEGPAPSELIACLVFTPEIQKALGLPDGTVPQGMFVGFEVPAESFEKVTSGSMLMFSIEGVAEPEKIEIDDEEAA
jgi:hypothetical protein